MSIHQGLYYPTKEELSLATSYSTEEVETNRTWIDGSPIYKKTINCGNLPNNGVAKIPHYIDGIDKVVDLGSPVMMNQQESETWSVPYMSLQSLSADKTDITIYTTSDLSAFHAYVTLYYTKVEESE